MYNRGSLKETFPSTAAAHGAVRSVNETLRHRRLCRICIPSNLTLAMLSLTQRIGPTKAVAGIRKEGPL
jgi:hypothetical protein